MDGEVVYEPTEFVVSTFAEFTKKLPLSWSAKLLIEKDIRPPTPSYTYDAGTVSDSFGVFLVIVSVLLIVSFLAGR